MLKTYDGLLSEISCFLLQLWYEPLYFFKSFCCPYSTPFWFHSQSFLLVWWSWKMILASQCWEFLGLYHSSPIQKLLHTSLALTCIWSWPMPFLFSATVLTFTCCIFQSVPKGYVSRHAGQLVFSPFAFSHIDTDNIQICGYWWFVIICCKCCPQVFGFDIQFVLFLSGYFER